VHEPPGPVRKTTGTRVWLIGHVTSDGEIAGPKTIEHDVDVVLDLEQGAALEGNERILRVPTKNRFGRPNVVGRLEITAKGFACVDEAAGTRAVTLAWVELPGTPIPCSSLTAPSPEVPRVLSSPTSISWAFRAKLRDRSHTTSLATRRERYSVNTQRLPWLCMTSHKLKIR